MLVADRRSRFELWLRLARDSRAFMEEIYLIHQLSRCDENIYSTAREN